MTTLNLTADRLFDGTGTAALIRPTLRVADERVEAVERGLLPPAGCSGERLDFPGCTILPGLIDTHVHLIFSALETNEAIIEQVGRVGQPLILGQAADQAADGRGILGGRGADHRRGSCGRAGRIV
jgi:imidazolonepropionase-like amidohydrolase